MINSFIRCLVFSITIFIFLAACSDQLSRRDDSDMPEERLEVAMFQVGPLGNEVSVGKVFIYHADEASLMGVRLQPELHDLPPGQHGFHVHENPSCDPGKKDGNIVPALAAGGHYDPHHTGDHQGPVGEGHLGDLPVLTVDQFGKTVTQIEAHRLSLSDLRGRSLVIHEGADNYSNTPPLGGGGSRIACGIIE